MGKGTFLTEQAKAHPETNFVGVEYARWFWRYASDRMRRNQCDNARTVRAEAFYFLQEHVPDASVSVMHIYFPDPWPKKRHHKRRLVQPEVAALMARKLMPGGTLHAATDWPDYAEQMAAVFGAEPLLVPASGGFAPRPATKFESRGRRLGHPIRDLHFRRRQTAPAAR